MFNPLLSKGVDMIVVWLNCLRPFFFFSPVFDLERDKVGAVSSTDAMAAGFA